MGFLSDLFKPRSQPEEDAQRSAQLMERLKARRGAETGKWLALMEQSGKAPPPVGPPPTIEDLDQRDIIDEAPYEPPLEAQYVDASNDAAAPRATVQDIDKREDLDDAPYVPPLETQYLDVSDGLAPPAPAAAQENQTVTCVERLFAEFDRQAGEFNASGSQMVLNVQHPAFSFEPPHYGEAYDPHQKISVFKGHISANHWAMLVQGYEEKIDVYMIAAEQVLSFTLNDIRKSNANPFMHITSSMDGDRRVWNISGATVSLETIPLLSKELLGDLIRIDAGTMSEAELFAHPHTELKLGETVAKPSN